MSSRPREVVVVIPSRFGAQRFPGKPLAADTGKPMVQHVYEAAARSKCVSRVIVATDDDRIADVVRGFGGEPFMTSSNHDSGTSRIAEVAQSLTADLIVNVQGDEPEMEGSLIDAAVEALAQDDGCAVATIASPFGEDEDPGNPNMVKVVLDQLGRALYFSRALIPGSRDPEDAAGPYLKHIGLYVYRRSFLLNALPKLSKTPLEESETLEQLRWLESGYEITVAIRRAVSVGIDTPEQYAAFVERWRAKDRSQDST